MAPLVCIGELHCEGEALSKSICLPREVFEHYVVVLRCCQQEEGVQPCHYAWLLATLGFPCQDCGLFVAIKLDLFGLPVGASGEGGSNYGK